MTTRRGFLLTLGSAALAGGPALAQQDAATRSVVRQLEAQGFDVYSVRSTWLGRVRVLSRRGDLQREIVFDPRNGSILRDLTVDDGGAPSVGPQPGSARGSGSDDRQSGGGRDDDDDDGGGRDDDDDDGGGGRDDDDDDGGGGRDDDDDDGGDDGDGDDDDGDEGDDDDD
ncbi:MAG: hypothetical protein ACOCY0_01070 [Roseicyclus sp.]